MSKMGWEHAKMEMTIDEQANDIRHMFEARLITRKEYGELIRKMEAEFDETFIDRLQRSRCEICNVVCYI